MNRKNLTELTRGEEEIMQILWQLESGNVNEIIEHLEEPKPKYTTVATFLKILEEKGFARHEAAGKSNRYYPTIEREEYARGRVNAMLSSYFGGSLSQLVTCFSRHEKISIGEMNEIVELMEQARVAKENEETK